MLNPRTRSFLEAQKVGFATLPHRAAYTAQGVAAASHVTGWHVAKVVVVDSDTGPLMVVLPASCRLDLQRFAQRTGKAGLTLAPESEVEKLFPDCAPGAMPPFGQLYGLPVFVDACLAQSPEIVFQAGSHHEVVRMLYADYQRLVAPVVADFCAH